MGDLVFNVAKGRTIEFYNRVKSNDPATSALLVVILAASGLESDDTLEDYDDLAAVLAASNNEPTNAGYARKVLTDTDLAALPAPDDTNNRRYIPLPNQTWSAVQVTGGAWGKLLVCYIPIVGTSPDSGVTPLTAHNFVITPDGSSIATDVHVDGFAGAVRG